MGILVQLCVLPAAAGRRVHLLHRHALSGLKHLVGLSAAWCGPHAQRDVKATCVLCVRLKTGRCWHAVCGLVTDVWPWGRRGSAVCIEVCFEGAVKLLGQGQGLVVCLCDSVFV